MVATYYMNSMQEDYKRVVDDLAMYGSRISPRGVDTFEHSHVGITLARPECSLPVGIGRGVNVRIGIAEALQLIAGESHPDLMLKIAPNFHNFTNGGRWFHGAYGPRVRPQIDKVINILERDQHSRQAVVTIWDPLYDGYGDVNDTPCTTTLQFLRRNGGVEMSVYMRSNDVWWGLAYDMYQFTMLGEAVADHFCESLVKYTHFVGSFHLYQRDVEKSNDLFTKVPGEQDYRWWGKLTDGYREFSVHRDVASCILSNAKHPRESETGTLLRKTLHSDVEL